jgi:hypothetical protein
MVESCNHYPGKLLESVGRPAPAAARFVHGFKCVKNELQILEKYVFISKHMPLSNCQKINFCNGPSKGMIYGKINQDV